MVGRSSRSGIFLQKFFAIGSNGWGSRSRALRLEPEDIAPIEWYYRLALTPERASPERLAVVTWTIVALNVLLFLWDRQMRLFGPAVIFADLAVVPKDVTAGLKGQGDPFSLAFLFTATFLHGNILHLVGNLIFLITFGPAVEAALGGPRYALYYLAWGILAFLTQVWVNPASNIPVLGASGAIGGVLGAFLILFPSSPLEIVIPPLFVWRIKVYAWVLLGGWFLFQLFVPQEGVATWAHVGGFLAGMLTVLIMGGRTAVLNRAHIDPDEF